MIEELVIGAVALGAISSAMKKKKKKEQPISVSEQDKSSIDLTRENTVFNFPKGMDESDFKAIVRNACKNIPAIVYVGTYDSIVACIVSNGNSLQKWNFKLDFNDYGQLTGKVWITTEIGNSNLPQVLADRILWGMQEYWKQCKYNTCPKCKQKMIKKPSSDMYICNCCGNTIEDRTMQNSIKMTDIFCHMCGMRISVPINSALHVNCPRCHTIFDIHS